MLNKIHVSCIPARHASSLAFLLVLLRGTIDVNKVCQITATFTKETYGMPGMVRVD